VSNHAGLPVVRDGHASVTVVIGEHRSARSPAEVFSPLAGYEVAVPAGRSEISLSPAGGRRLARFFVVGGVPFAEPLVMWWNFVARTGAEIAQAREDWIAGRFGEVRGYPGGPLAAPPLPPVPLKPR
jgi:quercetin 2,3-dioxygenase